MRKFWATAILAVTMGSAAAAATVQNGSFEAIDVEAVYGKRYTMLSSGSGDLAAWTIEEGSIDLMGENWTAADSRHSLDMSGRGIGVISQMITDLVVGAAYKLSFSMAGNPAYKPEKWATTKALTASIADASQTFTFDITDRGRYDMGWETKTLDFVAGATSELLMFRSHNDSAAGPALDAVSISGPDVASVPLPAAGVLLLAGMGALAGLGRRARQS